MTKTRLTALTLALTTASTLTACGSSHSHATSSTTTKTTSKPSSAYEGQEGPTNNDDAIIAKVTPLPNAGKGWVLRQRAVGYGTDTIAVTDDSTTKLTGLSDRDGSTQWTLDLTKPPSPITVSGNAPDLHQIGSSIAVHWSGTSGQSTLDTGQPAEETAVYDLNTGKLRGKPWVNTSPNTEGSSMTTSLAYANSSTTDNPQYILQDGTLDTNGGAGPGKYNLNIPGQDSSTTYVAQDVDSSTAIVTWTNPQSAKTTTGQFYDRHAKRFIGQPVTCQGNLPYIDSETTYESPDKQYINSDPFIADTKAKTMTCFHLPTNNLQSFSLSNAGVIYAIANNNFITMPLGSNKPSFITTTNQMAGLSLAHADLYGGISDGSDTNTVTVVFPKK